ncbi:ATP-dependent helicase [Falsibacillus albus]|uniref:DNA 3'-5' helicase n=1 Tax=Falsibacillus albus TaxID=2478915 RepID=A0A3L7JQF3_9BACI|nr:ATP-dependent helicase [Falsibacillus albus]RLQ92289.1 ATP-dependent helicase [Falsibacillus albus]
MFNMQDFFTRKKKELGVSLNDVQTKAVLQTEGPLLLLASPGSGKTTTVIMRIGYLIEKKGISPDRIKAVTFSKASASDMKERFKRFFPGLPPVDFSTIHSLAFEVAREHFRKTRTPFDLIEGNVSGDDQGADMLHKKVILRRLFKTHVGENITDSQMEELTTYISFIKNKMIKPDQWSTVSCDVPKAEQILKEYERFKRSHPNKLLVDFDDMLTIANEVLWSDRQLLWEYQQRYDYVLTDESQDTSLVQHEIIEKLVREHQNLCVVADDDQSIYSWRGAEPSYLLDFKKVYPKAEILFMEQNYRSTKDIVSVANRFIKRNKKRYEKNMFTENPAFEPIQIKELHDYNAQAKYLVKEIQGKENLGEIAVLYRNNSSSIALMNAFDRAGIPFYMKDADNRFFSHWVVEDVLNFMRMAFTDKRPDILEKIHLKFNGYISKQQMKELKGIRNGESVFDNLVNHVELKPYQVRLIKDSKETFRELKEMPPRKAIRVIRNQLGYEKALEKMSSILGFRLEYLIGILNTLEEIAVNLETLQDFAKRLQHLESALTMAKRKKGQNAVTFSTFHSSKGLEFEHVYMIDLINGVIPSKEDKEDMSLIEEATRLFYVGMTRAKKHLELITYWEKDGVKTAESTFVRDVKNMLNPAPKRTGTAKSGATVTGKKVNGVPFNPNAVQRESELEVGLTVKHRVFGTGEITGVDGDTVKIQFSTKGKVLSIMTCLEMGLLELV